MFSPINPLLPSLPTLYSFLLLLPSYSYRLLALPSFIRATEPNCGSFKPALLNLKPRGADCGPGWDGRADLAHVLLERLTAESRFAFAVITQ